MVYWGYRPLGKVEIAYQTSQEALRIANESGDIFSLGHANFALGISYYLKGRLKEAEKYLLRSTDLLQKINILTLAGVANFRLSLTYLDMGEYETSQKKFERAISNWQRINAHASFIIVLKICIVLAKVMDKEKDINLNEVFKSHGTIKQKYYKLYAQNRIAAILLNIDDQHIQEAEDWIIRSIETHQRYGMMWYLARDYTLYADLFKRKGDLSKAREKLTKAIEIFNECGADGWVEKYQKELAEL